MDLTFFYIKKKYELREEIIYTSQAIVQTLKERIEKAEKESGVTNEVE